jgi:hypothetical protein
VLKAYAIGFAGAAAAVLVAVLIAGGVPFADDEEGLRWGGTVYTSKQEFLGYLKSKGLSYDVWLERNPGAAPWEPAPEQRRSTGASASPQAQRAPSGAESNRDLPAWLPLAAITAVLAAGMAFLLTRGLPSIATARIRRPALALERRSVRVPSFGTAGDRPVPPPQPPTSPPSSRPRSTGSGGARTLPSLRVPTLRVPTVRLPTLRPPTLRLPTLRPPSPRRPAQTTGGGRTLPSLRRLSLAATAATRRLGSALPSYREGARGAARASAHRIRALGGDRNIRLADVAFAVLAVLATVMFVLFVVVLMTA